MSHFWRKFSLRELSSCKMCCFEEKCVALNSTTFPRIHNASAKLATFLSQSGRFPKGTLPSRHVITHACYICSRGKNFGLRGFGRKSALLRTKFVLFGDLSSFKGECILRRHGAKVQESQCDTGRIICQPFWMGVTFNRGLPPSFGLPTFVSEGETWRNHVFLGVSRGDADLSISKSHVAAFATPYRLTSRPPRLLLAARPGQVLSFPRPFFSVQQNHTPNLVI